MDTLSGKATYPMYTYGSQAWANAVKADFDMKLIDYGTYSSLLAGVTDPLTGKLVPKTPDAGWLGNILSGVGAAGDSVLSMYAKLMQLDMQKAQAEYQMQLAKYNVVSGMAGEGQQRGYGGLNIFTLAAFAGVGLLAMILLKKS